MEEENKQMTSENTDIDSEKSEQSDVTNETETVESEKEQEKFLITEEDRKRFPNLPEKFKDWNSVIAWGIEAEKAKSRAEAEKANYERQIQEYEEIIAEMQAAKEEKASQSQVSGEDREKMLAQFREDWETDPLETLQKVLDVYISRIEAKTKSDEMVKKWEQEEREILKDPQYKDIWETEVRPALYKIAKERPYLTSIEEVLAIYERQKAKEKRFLEQESAKKKTEKKSAFSESGGGGGSVAESLAKKIASAKSIEELEKLASQIK